VLATAGVLLHDSTMIRSAEREARGFYAFLLTDGFMKELDVAHPDRRAVFEQIAYAVRPMTLGLLRLYDATGDRDYLVMAGLAASWLSGNNIAHQKMYDPQTGRCFDGITDSTTINRNAGAESTIEALYTLVELGQYPEALRYYRVKKMESGAGHGIHYALFSDANGGRTLLAGPSHRSGLMVGEGSKVEELLRSIDRKGER
jgi:uncharacterized protein YyaL (SSP411 family)